MTVTRDDILADCRLYLKDSSVDADKLAEVVWRVYATEPQQRAELMGAIKPQLPEDDQYFLDNVARLVAHYDSK